jgi:hypothetical protein
MNEKLIMSFGTKLAQIEIDPAMSDDEFFDVVRAAADAVTGRSVQRHAALMAALRSFGDTE